MRRRKTRARVGASYTPGVAGPRSHGEGAVRQSKPAHRARPAAYPAQSVSDAFGTFHPALCFGFFAGALVLGMCLRHPVFQAIGVAAALLYYLRLRGRACVRLLAWIVPLCVLVTVINPLFDTLGETVLFTWWGGRPYTLEALYAGLSAGAMVATVLLWFGCYNAVMTSDKFLYLFGRVMPSASLVLTMALRLVPRFQGRLRDVAAAVHSVGARGPGASRKDRLHLDGRILAALSGWALERSVVAADSMRARGFGLPGRTAFARYRFTGRDAALLAVFASLAALVLVSLTQGAAQVSYVPSFAFAPASAVGIVGYASYAAFLIVPTAIDLGEAVLWRSSLSRI